MRRETDVHFAVDEAFLASGGVQYFYELAKREPSPETASATFALFRDLDAPGRWRSDRPLHVVMSRLVYEVDKDVAFFSEARAFDLPYINTVAPEYRISRQPDGGFRSDAMPANVFRLEYLHAVDVARRAGEPGLARVLGFLGAAGPPASVVFQQNDDFARVLGMRTAELGLTWTAHVALKPGRTRLYVCTMSYLHSLPPFFLGGEQRVFRESHGGAALLIERLRAYRDPD